MRRTGTGRLLSPAEMTVLRHAVIGRDQSCIVCGERDFLDAHHILPQSIIKKAYLKVGGKLLPGASPSYRPLTRFEFWEESEITASEIAADPDTAVALCRHHHDLAEKRHDYLLDKPELSELRRRIRRVGEKYDLLPKLERYYGREL